MKLLKRNPNRPCWLITLLLILPVWLCFSQPLEPSFIRISKKDGLSSGTVYQVVQDQRGFIWVGTSNGLNRYDGHSFKTFYADAGQPGSLSHHNIRCLLVDSRDNLWIGTRGGGLNRYNYNTKTFEPFRHNPDDPASLSHDEVLSIYEDRQGQLWVGTEKGLNLFDPDTKRFKRFVADNNNPSSLGANAVLCAFEDSKNNLWIGTWDGGLNLAIPAADSSKDYSFLCIKTDARRRRGLQSNHIWSIVEDKNGNLWIGTFEGSLHLLIPPENENYRQSKPEDFSFRVFGEAEGLSNSQVISLAVTPDNNLWLGTLQGLNVFDLTNFDQNGRTEIKTFYSNEFDNSIPQNEIRNLFLDKDSLLWISTFGGIGIYNFKQPKISSVQFSGKENQYLYHSCLIDEAGNRWIGTDGAGLIQLDDNTGKMIKYRHPEKHQAFDKIYYLFQERPHTIWLGTAAGLSSFNTTTKIFTVAALAGEPPGITHGQAIWKIFKDSRQQYWLATQNGLVKTTLPPENSTIYFPDADNPLAISDEIIKDLDEDRFGNLWICTSGGGLSQLNLSQSDEASFTSYKFDAANSNSIKSDILTTIALNREKDMIWIGTENGISKYYILRDSFVQNVFTSINDRILSLETDRLDRVWFATADGLHCYDETADRLSVFEPVDGSLGNNYLGNANKELNGHRLFFGGKGGFTLFSPDRLHQKAAVPVPVITDLSIFNKSVVVNEKDKYLGAAILDQNIINTASIELSHRHNVITLEYAVPDYLNARRYAFAYMLEGLEKDWNYSKTNRVTYTSLDPGNYTFKVKVLNNEGFWSETNTLHIGVIPPFWQQPWFIFLAISCFLGLIGWFVRKEIHAIRQNKKDLEDLVLESTRDMTVGRRMNQTRIVQLSVEDVLRESEAFFRSLYQQSPLGIVFADHNGKVIKMNRQFSKMLAQPDEPIIGNYLPDFFKPADKLKLQREIENSTRQKGQLLKLEVSAECRGRSRWFDLAISFLFDKDQELRYMIMMMGDVSARKTQDAMIQNLLSELQSKNDELEDKVRLRTADLKKSNEELQMKNEELERFAFIASHDLKEPLRNISSFIGLINRRVGTQLPEEVKEYFNLINRNTRQMTNLITDVLEYSRVNKENINSEPVDLNHLLRDVQFALSQMIQDRKAQIKVSELFQVSTNRGLLFLIIKNLVENGIKYNESALPVIEVTGQEEAEYFHIEIKDNGIGIAPEYHDQIFEMFKRLHNRSEYSGSGLGLALCKRIINQLEGSISVKSEEDGGSIFRFSIAKKAASAPWKDLPTSGQKIQSLPQRMNGH